MARLDVKLDRDFRPAPQLKKPVLHVSRHLTTDPY